MSVSYPKGVMAPAVSALLTPPVKAKAAPAGGFAKALTHHGHAGAALKAGNAKKAMHHIGHMMLAIRNASASQVAPAPVMAAPSPMPDDSDGTNEMAESLPAPSKAPAKKPFNRGVFSAMGSKR